MGRSEFSDDEMANFLGLAPPRKVEFFGVRYLTHPLFENEGQFRRVMRKTPWIIRYTPFGSHPRELAKIYRKELLNGFVADVEVRLVGDEVGHGLFARKRLLPGTFLAEYTGVVREYNPFRPSSTAYSMAYPKMPWTLQSYLIDAKEGGNETRFINHSETPNLKATAVCDRGLMRIVLVTTGRVEAGEELRFDYGPDYWRSRGRPIE